MSTDVTIFQTHQTTVCVGNFFAQRSFIVLDLDIFHLNIYHIILHRKVQHQINDISQINSRRYYKSILTNQSILHHAYVILVSMAH